MSWLNVTEILAPEAVTAIISSLFVQIDYGCQPSDFPPSKTTTKVPAVLQLKYWEVQEPEKHFVKDQLEAVLSRRREREKARKDIELQLAGMDDLEKWELLKGDKVDKGDKGKKEVEGAKKETAAMKKEVEVSETVGPSGTSADTEEVSRARIWQSKAD